MYLKYFSYFILLNDIINMVKLMINNIYVKVKNFIKDNLWFFIVLGIIILINFEKTRKILFMGIFT